MVFGQNYKSNGQDYKSKRTKYKGDSRKFNLSISSLLMGANGFAAVVATTNWSTLTRTSKECALRANSLR